eukprot:scaffold576771_cov15-Prasinocladus_malaysianus.AAC.1
MHVKRHSIVSAGNVAVLDIPNRLPIVARVVLILLLCVKIRAGQRRGAWLSVNRYQRLKSRHFKKWQYL